MTGLFRNSVLKILWVLPCLGLSGCLFEGPTEDSSTYLESSSEEIAGVEFDWSSHLRKASGSDNWPSTWADDGHQYAFWGDGGGFGGTNVEGRVSWGVARIEGTFDDYVGVNINGGVSSIVPSSGIDGKTHGAPLFVDDALYAWVTPESGARGYASSTLYKSSDYGRTWSRTPVRFSAEDHRVAYLGFLNAGQAYSGAREDVVYAIGIEPSTTDDLLVMHRPGRIHLLRVDRGGIEQRRSYQWFGGSEGTTPMWGSITERVPIVEEAEGLGPFPQIIFVPELERYLLTAEHSGVDGGGSNSGNLLLLDSPRPWGPWTEVARVTNWGREGGFDDTIFQWNFAPKWFRESGRKFTLIFSGTSRMDSWNTIHGRFHLRTALPDSAE